jgi:hypothetical protein
MGLDVRVSAGAALNRQVSTEKARGLEQTGQFAQTHHDFLGDFTLVCEGEKDAVGEEVLARQ